MKATIELGKVDYNGGGSANCPATLEVELREKKPTTEPYLDTNLMPLGDKYHELSICGNIWKPTRSDILSGGQNRYEILDFFKDNPDVVRLCEIWKSYHLNGMSPGTEQQTATLVEADKLKGSYNERCAHLKEQNLLFVSIPEESQAYFDFKRGADGELPTLYYYGMAWLTKRIPDEIVEELKAIVARLKKAAPPEEPEYYGALLERLGISFEVQSVPRNPNMDDRSGNHWFFRFSRGKQELCNYFTMGEAHREWIGNKRWLFAFNFGGTGRQYDARGPVPPQLITPRTTGDEWDRNNLTRPTKPKPKDVLSCLVMDALMCEGFGFEEWADQLGYDSDSRKAFASYELDRKRAVEARKFFGSEEWERMLEAER